MIRKHDGTPFGTLSTMLIVFRLMRSSHLKQGQTNARGGHESNQYQSDQVIGEATRNFDFIWTRLTSTKVCTGLKEMHTREEKLTLPERCVQFFRACTTHLPIRITRWWYLDPRLAKAPSRERGAGVCGPEIKLCTRGVVLTSSSVPATSTASQ